MLIKVYDSEELQASGFQPSTYFAEAAEQVVASFMALANLPLP